MARGRKAVKRRRSTLKPKYFVRRLALVLVPPLLIITVAVLLLVRGLTGTGEEQGSASPESPSSQGLDPEPTPKALEPESDPDPEPPSEPEPEPQPVVNTVDWSLLLVSPTNPIPGGYMDALELETITGQYQVDKRIADNVRRMFTKAKEDGINLMICAAFRNEEEQAELFEERKREYLDEGMSEEEAVSAAQAAKPGFSEHHTGLALDIVTSSHREPDEGFAETAAFGWLDQNAAEYGFIMRYPKNKEGITRNSYEPWHYRYVGVEHAKAIRGGGYCLEEYLREQIERMARTERERAEADLDEPAALDGQAQTE